MGHYLDIFYGVFLAYKFSKCSATLWLFFIVAFHSPHRHASVSNISFLCYPVCVCAAQGAERKIRDEERKQNRKKTKGLKHWKYLQFIKMNLTAMNHDVLIASARWYPVAFDWTETSMSNFYYHQ